MLSRLARAPIGVERRRHPRRGRAADRAAATSSPTAAVRGELAEDLTARTLATLRAAARPAGRTGAHPRAHLARTFSTSKPTSPRGSPRARALPRACARHVGRRRRAIGLDVAQRDVVAALAGDAAAGGRRGRGRRRQDHHAGRRPHRDRARTAAGWWLSRRRSKAAESPPSRSAPSLLGGVAGPPARLPMGRARHVDATRTRRRRPGHRHRLPGPSETRNCAAVTCCWSTRPGCSTRTPPARCSPSPTSTAPGSRWWGTGTNCPRSGAAACSTSPPAGPHRTRASRWTRCTASPAPTTSPDGAVTVTSRTTSTRG